MGNEIQIDQNELANAIVMADEYIIQSKVYGNTNNSNLIDALKRFIGTYCVIRDVLGKSSIFGE